jgi:hypothetical protein
MKWRLVPVAGTAIIILITFWRVASRPAFRQKSNEVVIREPGKRSLGQPQPVASEAWTDLEFAWLSQAAYQHVAPGKKAASVGCPDPDFCSSKDWLDAAGEFSRL